MPRAEMKIAGKAVVIDVDPSAPSRLRVDIDDRRGSLLADRDARAVLTRCLESEHVERVDEPDRAVFEYTDSFVSGMSTTSRVVLTLRSATEVQVTAEKIANEINPHVGW